MLINLAAHMLSVENRPRHSRFDLVIFDCDGVLVDSEIISCSIVARMMAPLGSPYDLSQALTRYLGRPATAVTDDYVQLTGRSLPDGFMVAWRKELFDDFNRELTQIAGVREAIATIGLPYCLASSSDEERIEFCLRKTGLMELFEGQIYSTTMVTNGKPAPDLFLLAANQMGATPQRCLVVEDSVSGIKAAKAAGMTACGFTGGSHFAVLDLTHELIGAGADHVVGSMKDLSIHVESLNRSDDR
jgi:HAD superfamily hydrolase (TIGR01509 family)